MTFVEIKRLRGLLTAYAIGCAFLAVVAGLVFHSHGIFTLHLSADKSGVRLSDLLVLGTIMSYIVAAFCGTHLAAERSTLPFLWTRPRSRIDTALRFVAADIAAIAIAIAIGVLVQWAVLATVGLGGAVRFDDRTPGVIPLALGSAVAWYALVMVASVFRDAEHGSVAAVLSWPVFVGIVLLATIAIEPDLRWAMALVAHVDPLAYLLGSFSDANLVRRAGEVWLLAAVAGGLAVASWIRSEA
jgi:hypothetical protein